MLTVACVLRTGYFKERFYTPIWVKRLKQRVDDTLGVPHRFVCLSNIDFPLEGCEVRRLEHEWPGWWSKIELFSPLLDDCERVLYLDLDTLIVGQLDELVQRSEPMVLLPAMILTPKKGCVRRYQSSCMLWTPPQGREIYRRFVGGVTPKKYRGDQDWIGFVKPDCATFDPSVACKLDACVRGVPPGVTLVLAVGGKNAEAAARYEWAKDAWLGRERELAEV